VAVEIISAGLLTTVQDLGRQGYQRFGVPVSGAMDAFALQAANGLVGNPVDAAGLEITVAGPKLRLTRDCMIAVTGADLGLQVQGSRAPLWTALSISAGATITFEGHRSGCRAYLAVNGGIGVPQVMGSRATCLDAAFGGFRGRAVRAGDILPVGACPLEGISRPGRSVPEHVRPRYDDSLIVRVIVGPQWDHFAERGLHTLTSSEYLVSSASNRTGYRLVGPAIEARTASDIVSDGIPLGAIQVPGDGQPILMMADRPTTGGYAKIATVISADIPLLAQLLPGVGRLRFETTSIEVAQAVYRRQMTKLRESVRMSQDCESPT